jgi:hypothetical protein
MIRFCRASFTMIGEKAASVSDAVEAPPSERDLARLGDVGPVLQCFVSAW